MSLRFRKVVKIFPGVKLNITAQGVSLTLGSSPLSFNFGRKKKIYANVSIPGTGVWTREEITSSKDRTRR